MSVIIYGSKSFIVENSYAAQILQDAANLQKAGDVPTAKLMLSLAVQVEAGTMADSEAKRRLSGRSIAA